VQTKGGKSSAKGKRAKGKGKQQASSGPPGVPTPQADRKMIGSQATEAYNNISDASQQVNAERSMPQMDEPLEEKPAMDEAVFEDRLSSLKENSALVAKARFSILILTLPRRRNELFAIVILCVTSWRKRWMPDFKFGSPPSGP
jgi:hypothetical protein